MSSFFKFIKQVLMNRVLPKAPDWLLRLYYEEVMEPKAKVDYRAISTAWSHYRLDEMYKYPSFAQDHAGNSPKVFGVVGLPHAGKTTLAEALTQYAHAFRVDSNVIRNLLVDAGV